MVCSVQNYATALMNVKRKVYRRRNSEQDVEDDPYLTDGEFVDDDWDSEEEDMDIEDLENDYFFRWIDLLFAELLFFPYLHIQIV